MFGMGIDSLLGAFAQNTAKKYLLEEERQDVVLDGLRESEIYNEAAESGARRRMVNSPAGLVKSLAEIGGWFAGRSEETDEGTEITIGDPGTSDMADMMTGATGLQELMQGNVGIGNSLDALGVAFDAGMPGPPIMPMIAGLGLDDSLVRIAQKLRKANPENPTALLSETAEQAKEMVRVLQERSATRSATPVNVRGAEGRVIQHSYLTGQGLGDTTQVIIAPSKEYPRGLRMSLARDPDDLSKAHVLGAFDILGKTGREMENTTGAGSFLAAAKEAAKTLPGVEQVDFQRVGGVARRAGREGMETGTAPSLEGLWNQFPEELRLDILDGVPGEMVAARLRSYGPEFDQVRQEMEQLVGVGSGGSVDPLWREALEMEEQGRGDATEIYRSLTEGEPDELTEATLDAMQEGHDLPDVDPGMPMWMHDVPDLRDDITDILDSTESGIEAYDRTLIALEDAMNQGVVDQHQARGLVDYLFPVTPSQSRGADLPAMGREEYEALHASGPAMADWRRDAPSLRTLKTGKMGERLLQETGLPHDLFLTAFQNAQPHYVPGAEATEAMDNIVQNLFFKLMQQ